jgi:hypothetical protein
VPVRQQLFQQRRVDLSGVADQPDVVRHRHRGHQPTVLSGQSDRARAGLAQPADEVFADRQQDHPHDLHRLRGGDPKPLVETAFDPDTVKHPGDLRPAAVHDDHPVPLVHQGFYPLGERLRLLHGVAAVLDDSQLAHDE